MAGLILPSVRTTQPQQAVGINWSNPITKGLVFCTNQADNIDLVSKTRGVQVGIINKSISAIGFSTQSPNKTSAIDYPAIRPVSSIDKGLTIVVFAQAVAEAIISRAVAIGNEAASSYTACQVIFNGNNISGIASGKVTIMGYSSGIVFSTHSIDGVVDGLPHVWVFSGIQGQSFKIYRDGIDVSLAATGTNSAFNFTSGVRLHGSPVSISTGFKYPIYQTSVYARQISSVEIKSLSGNPWQIFAPRPRRLFIVPSAGGAYTLDSNVSNYYLTPFNCDILQNKLLNSTLATISLTGQNSGLLFGRTINSSSNSFLEVGTDTSLLVNRVVSTTLGSLTLSGNSTDLLVSKVLLSGASSFNLNGLAASLTYTPVGAYILVGDTSSYSFNAQAAGLLYNRIVSGTGGSFTLNGLTSNLLKGFNLPASLGSFIEAGLPITLTYNVLTGYTLSCDNNSFTLSALDSSILVDRLLASNLASFTLSGASSILMASGVSVSTAENTWQIVIKTLADNAIAVKTLPNSLLIKQLQSNNAYTDITALAGGVIATTNLSGTTTALDITTISSTQTSGTYKLNLTDKVLTATGSVGPFRYVTLYNSTATGFELIGWYDYGTSVTLATGETFTVNFEDVNGTIFTLV